MNKNKRRRQAEEAQSAIFAGSASMCVRRLTHRYALLMDSGPGLNNVQSYILGGGIVRGKAVSAGKAHQIIFNYLDHGNLHPFKRMMAEFVNYTWKIDFLNGFLC